MHHQPQVREDQRVAGVVDVTHVLLDLAHLRALTTLRPVLAAPAQHSTVESLEVVERPVGARLRTVDVGFQTVLTGLKRELQRHLGHPLASFLELTSERDFLTFVDQRSRPHLAEVDGQNRRRRLVGGLLDGRPLRCLGLDRDLGRSLTHNDLGRLLGLDQLSIHRLAGHGFLCPPGV